MSSPAPVPSKAAIHALRGLLFGTSCSLVLLAEERRQRIKIARSAVENGRKLKCLKRYSSSGGAALEAIQEEVLSDPNFVGWSSRSRSRSSSHDRGTLAFESAYLNQVAHDVGPDPRRPTREARGRAATRNSSEEATLPGRLTQYASDASRPRSLPSFAKEASKLGRVPVVLQIAESTARHRRPAHKNAIGAILDAFWEDNPHLRAPEDLEAGLTKSLSRHTPSAAVRLVRRAYNSTASSQELPGWLIRLSSLLSTACQQEGDFLAAGRILEVIVEHGPISLKDYMSHRPLELVNALISHNLQEANDRGLVEQIDLAARLYSANIADVGQADPLVRQSHTRIGKELIVRALKANLSNNVIGVFRRLRTLAENPIPETVWFIGQLRNHKEHSLAIDAFVGIYANLAKTSKSSQDMCGIVVDSVSKANGYGALEVLKRINLLRERDGWTVPSTWIKDVLWSYWASSRSYEGTRNLFDYVSHNHFYNIGNTYDIQSRMVRICLEANDVVSAQSLFERLFSTYPDARDDKEILGAFAVHKAGQGDWDGVRADYEAMKRLQSFPESQRKEFNRMFSTVLETYSKDHTWGETEGFLETYVQELGVSLDRYLVRFIADRHGKCRDLKAMGRWLKFCKDAGYKTDSLFWTSIFTACKRDWKYDTKQVLDLYHELLPLGIRDDFPDVDKIVKGLTLTNTYIKLNRHVAVSHRYSLADERNTFERMRLEAQHDNWECVLSVYRRAVHNGMGHSGRCLRLAVRASVHFNGSTCSKARSLLSKAQSEGHDISGAVVPLVLAQLDEIEDALRESVDVESGRRGRPYDAIKAVLDDLQGKGIHIDDNVFARAARVCLDLRNYREVVTLCVLAARTNGGGDLCYNIHNFRYLLQAYTVRHEYDRVRWLLAQLRDRDYRYLRACRQTLNWVVNYLKFASRANKPEELRRSDLETCALVMETRAAIAAENVDFKAVSKQVVLDAVTPDGRRPVCSAANAMRRAGAGDPAVQSFDDGEEAIEVSGRENVQVAGVASW